MGVNAVYWAATAVAAASAVDSHQQASKAADKQAASEANAEATRPQASKAPTVKGVQADTAGAGQAGGAPGVAQTFLTGASGVDPSLLNLGKSTLLGS
jgi:hypothetical protein